MNNLGYMALAVLSVLLLLLIGKIHLLRRAARTLREGLQRQRETQSNTLLSLPCRDREMLALADCLNDELRTLRDARRRYEHGDLELKEAITNISHDLRTPLTAIFGSLALLEQEEKSEAAASYLSQIENRAEALKALTDELFRYSLAASVASLSPQPVELRACAGGGDFSPFTVRCASTRYLRVALSLPDRQVIRSLDPEALSRILHNILSNALKYSDGDLAVVMTEDGAITFRNAARHLTPITVGRLFDRYYTVEAAQNGTGLGLSIAKALTERMGGSISAACRDGCLEIRLTFH